MAYQPWGESIELDRISDAHMLHHLYLSIQNGLIVCVPLCGMQYMAGGDSGNILASFDVIIYVQKLQVFDIGKCTQNVARSM